MARGTFKRRNWTRSGSRRPALDCIAWRNVVIGYGSATSEFGGGERMIRFLAAILFSTSVVKCL